MRLAFDVGRGRLVLGVEGIKILVETLVGRDPRVDRAADPSSSRYRLHSGSPALIWGRLSRKPKKRGPFHLVPVMAKAISDRLSNVSPFHAKPSGMTMTRWDFRSHSRTRTVPGGGANRLWSSRVAAITLIGLAPTLLLIRPRPARAPVVLE